MADTPHSIAASRAALTELRGTYPEVAAEPTKRWSYFVYALIFASFAAVAYFQLHAVVLRVIEIAEAHERVKLFLYPSALWAGMGFLLLAFRTGVWIGYRPHLPASRADAPSLTVIIPAYNEGAMVLKSIESVVAADYPRDKLEIVVIDDGSKDDTWRYIREAADRYPGLVTALQHEKNRGKREALALGFTRGRGEIFVTIDSDSVIERDALLAIAGPFRDPKVGAVAGKVLVYNRASGLIPRMMHARFVLSFDMLRSVESVYNNVYCCPGALTALRASAVREVLEGWRTQTFLGSACTFGEDRAMTNSLLDKGYNTVYQRRAVVHTLVPEAYGKLCKMLLRWDRSYVREEIRFARIIWKRPLVTMLIALFDRIVTNLRYPIYYMSIGLLAFMVAQDPPVIIRILLAIGLVSFLNMLYFLRSERSWGFLYGVVYAYFSSIALFWIFPYAVMSVRAKGWLTR